MGRRPQSFDAQVERLGGLQKRLFTLVQEVFVCEEIEIQGGAMAEMKTHQSGSAGQEETLLPLEKRGQNLQLKPIESSQPATVPAPTRIQTGTPRRRGVLRGGATKPSSLEQRTPVS